VLCVVTWLWGTKYSPEYVERLALGVRRHLRTPHRFLVMTDRAATFSRGIEPYPLEDPELAGRGCLARLRMFDPGWQDRHGIITRLLCLDLDVVVVGPLDPLLARQEPLLVLRGANMSNPCPLNCSILALRHWAHPELWWDLTPERVASIPHHEFPDDQGWLWHRMPDTPGWELGPTSGVWAMGKGRGDAAWPRSNELPVGARLVAFPGHRDPRQFTHLPWVAQHWGGPPAH
jgi:hypothetical protein